MIANSQIPQPELPPSTEGTARLAPETLVRTGLAAFEIVYAGFAAYMRMRHGFEPGHFHTNYVLTGHEMHLEPSIGPNGEGGSDPWPYPNTSPIPHKSVILGDVSPSPSAPPPSPTTHEPVTIAPSHAAPLPPPTTHSDSPMPSATPESTFTYDDLPDGEQPNKAAEHSDSLGFTGLMKRMAGVTVLLGAVGALVIYKFRRHQPEEPDDRFLFQDESSES